MLAADVKAAEQCVQDAEKELPKRLAEWESANSKQIAGNKSAWELLNAESVKSTGGATLTKQEDGSYLAAGVNPVNDSYIITAKMPDVPASAFMSTLPRSKSAERELGARRMATLCSANFRWKCSAQRTTANRWP